MKMINNLFLWMGVFFVLIIDKLSNILFLLFLCQATYIYLTYHNLINTSIKFDILHEDTILIMHLMTWFIVRAIENTNKKENK